MDKIQNQSSIRVFKQILVCTGILLFLVVCGCGKKEPPIAPWDKTGGVATSGKYRNVVVADLDDDTYPDIIGASSDPGKVAIWYGNGTGNMTAPQFLPFKADVHSVAAGDFNEDGLKDLVMSVQQESSGIMIWMNQPGRKWKRGVEPIKINHYEGIRVCDINQDGHADIVAANATSDLEGGIQIWLGNGHGEWEMEAGPTVTGRYMDVEVADFNNDGKPDIVGAAWGTYGGIRLWLGDGTGNWSAMPPLENGSFYGLTICDINKDGNLDILAGSYRNGIHIYLGDGKGHFERAPGPVDNGSYWRAVAVNFNGDKQMDLLAASVDGKGIQAWRSHNNKNWEAITDRFPGLGDYYDLKVADLENNGGKYIIAASFGEGVKILSDKEWPYSETLNSAYSGFEQSADEHVVIPAENDVYTMKNGYEEYKVGPGDVLEIVSWEPDKTTKEEVEILPSGKISFSFVRDLYVNGMTLNELEKSLTEYLSEFIRDPRVSVHVIAYQSKWVSILGPGRSERDNGGGGWTGNNGRRGGRYYLDGKVSIIDMLSRSGIARDANLREIQVSRSNGRTLKLNIYKAMTLGDKTQDIILDSGDSVYVPIISKEGNRVFVFGEVKEPGAYPFTGTGITIIDSVAAAGGPTIFARPEYAKVVRGDIAKPEVIPVDLKKLFETGDQSQNITLQDGDLVYIPRRAEGDINIFVQRIRPIYEMIIDPIRAYDYIHDPNNNGNR